jgi:hypothetical protein
MASGLPGGQRLALVLSTSASAVLFAWAAWVLPSRPGSVPALVAGGLGAAHLGALLVLLFWPRRLRTVWRALSWLSLAVGALLASLTVVTAHEMVQRFGSLGIGVASLLGAIVVLVLLATVPFSAWGLGATRKRDGID